MRKHTTLLFLHPQPIQDDIHVISTLMCTSPPPAHLGNWLHTHRWLLGHRMNTTECKLPNSFETNSFHSIFREYSRMPKQPTVSVQPVSKRAGGCEVRIKLQIHYMAFWMGWGCKNKRVACLRIYLYFQNLFLSSSPFFSTIFTFQRIKLKQPASN